MAAQVNISHITFYKARKLRGYNPLQTVRCFPSDVDNTGQGKDLMGNYIISLETLHELVSRNQITLCCSLDQFARPSEI